MGIMFEILGGDWGVNCESKLVNRGIKNDISEKSIIKEIL